MKEVFVRSPYNYDAELVSDETGLDCLDVSLTKQSFVEECDINTIVRRFGLTGELPDGVRAPTFGDFTEVVDFKTACDAVAAARESFDALPAEVRARFRNDPQELVEFASDEANRAQLEVWGMVVPKEAGGPVEAVSAVSAGVAPAASTVHTT